MTSMNNGSVHAEKDTLRRSIRQLKRAATDECCRSWSARICNLLLSDRRLHDAATVISYAPLPDEVDVSAVTEWCRREGKTVLLPKVVSDTEMELRVCHGPDKLRAGRYNILEPTGPVAEPDSLTDAVALVPGMAFDREGYRLGRGKGYYDRFLARTSVKTIGVAFPFQIVDAVPHDEHDMRVDDVVTTE